MNTYAEKLRDPRWQKVRLKKLEASGWSCENCGDDTVMLSVHHKRYVKGRAPWEYERHELSVLCQPCHEAGHREQDIFRKALSALSVDGAPGSSQAAYGVVAGYICAVCRSGPAFEAASELEHESPFAFACGYAAAALIDGRLTIGGIHRLADALLVADGSDLAKDLDAVFEKHGMIAKGFDSK